jgi:hypothetical protein
LVVLFNQLAKDTESQGKIKPSKMKKSATTSTPRRIATAQQWYLGLIAVVAVIVVVVVVVVVVAAALAVVLIVIVILGLVTKPHTQL